MNNTYEYNKKTYQVYTLRVNKNTDGDLIDYLSKQESVNAHLLDLARADMRRHIATDNCYEVIEDRGIQKDILASFPTEAEAAEFVLLYVAGFDVGGRIYIVKRVSAELDGHELTAGIVQNLQKEEE